MDHHKRQNSLDGNQYQQQYHQQMHQQQSSSNKNMSHQDQQYYYAHQQQMQMHSASSNQQQLQMNNHIMMQQQQMQYAQLQQNNATNFTTTTTQQTSSTSTNSMSINGPRAKNNQVIYEAIAKSCEIAVRGRCTDLIDDSMTQQNNIMNNTNSNSRGYSDGLIGITATTNTAHATRGSINEKRKSWNYYGGRNAAANITSNSTSSRFNIEVDEVPEIRSIVSSTWKKTPHVPLRLDIYYEYDSCYNDSDQSNEIIIGSHQQQHQQQIQSRPPQQRELLERWCIDYIPSTQSSTSSSSPYNSLSSSSPSTSPHSSRIMVGAVPASSPKANTSESSKSSNMSQLRQVCKRIVVLLRSLHCMTRMLPSYRLKCLLLSNMTNGEIGGVAVNNPNLGTQAYNQQQCQSSNIGWGSIGFSIHVGEYHESSLSQQQYEPALPSPSFARHTLPLVPTTYGQLNVSVMYDATLNPTHMMEDIVDRRNEWIQRTFANQQQYQYQQQQQQQQYTNMIPQQPQHLQVVMTPTMSSSTQPIPIHTTPTQQHASPGSTSSQRPPLTINSLPRRREYGSCPPAVAAQMMGTPSSVGRSASNNTNQRSRAVSDFIISDYHYSPRMKPTLSSPGVDNTATGGENRRVMSGLTLAMMNEDDHTSPVEHAAVDNDDYRTRQQLHPQQQQMAQQQQNEEMDALILPFFGSPATRAAFHNPPPMYPEDTGEQQQHAYSSGMAADYNDRGTHFFQRHGGYGYGYNNGSNFHIGDHQLIKQQLPEEHVLPPPFDPTTTNMVGLSISPNPRRNTPPTHQGIISQQQQYNNQPSPSSATGTSYHSRSGTPPTSVLSSRHLVSSPKQYHQQGVSSSDGRGSDVVQRGSRHRTSSSSMVQQLLPPVNSLDTLQKSPFAAMAESRKSSAVATAAIEKGGDSSSSSNPQRLLSSIPKMVSGENDKSGSIAVSTLGGGEASSSNIVRTRNNTEELPFAVDDDENDKASPSKSVDRTNSKSLWGSTKADVLEGTLTGGGIGGGEMAETSAASSLAHRCATNGKIRLKMFESTRTIESETVTGSGGHNNLAASTGGPSIQDQLSEFRQFGASFLAE